MAWFFYALGSAALWGYSYALSDKVMRYGIKPIFLMCLTGIFYLIFSIVIAHFSGHLKSGMQLINSDKSILFEILILAACYVIGAYFINMAIHLKNASLANLIEISYPIFTIIFAYFLMKEVQINLSTMIGGLLIFSGIGVIYLKG